MVGLADREAKLLMLGRGLGKSDGEKAGGVGVEAGFRREDLR